MVFVLVRSLSLSISPQRRGKQIGCRSHPARSFTPKPETCLLQSSADELVNGQFGFHCVNSKGDQRVGGL